MYGRGVLGDRGVSFTDVELVAVGAWYGRWTKTGETILRAAAAH